MDKPQNKLLLITGLLALLSLGTIVVTSLPSQRTPITSYVYPVKFVCGVASSTTTILNPDFRWTASPGRYYTSINIQNPSATSTKLSKAIMLAPREPDSRPASTTITMILPGRNATAADCPDIYLNMGVHASSTVYMEGFLDIISKTELYVTAVYTGQNLGPDGTPSQLSTMDVEHIQGETLVR